MPYIPRLSETTAALRIALADDHPVVLLALRGQLEALPGVEVTSVCETGTDLIDALSTRPCDLVITDFAMSRNDAAHDGLELLAFLHRHFPKTQVLVFSSQANPGIIRRVMGMGLGGFVSKLDPISELIQAVSHLRRKRGAFYSSSARALIDPHTDLSSMSEPALSARELEVMRLYTKGHTLSQIAHILNRSVSTISTQKTAAMRKLGLQSNTELIRYAYAHQFI